MGVSLLSFHLRDSDGTDSFPEGGYQDCNIVWDIKNRRGEKKRGFSLNIYNKNVRTHSVNKFVILQRLKQILIFPFTETMKSSLVLGMINYYEFVLRIIIIWLGTNKASCVRWFSQLKHFLLDMISNNAVYVRLFSRNFLL